ncbi:Ion transport protein-domain-containing protein [Cladochytrium replicatum]|nr:Ion transport protein-domain-containing protein [Cladochytrium replicatum]
MQTANQNAQQRHPADSKTCIPRSQSNVRERIARVRVPRSQRPLVRFIGGFVNSYAFQWFVMLVILANVIAIALETDALSNSGSSSVPVVFSYLDLFFLAVYVVEFVLKIYVEPIGYWKEAYNRFDAVILFVSLGQWIAQFYMAKSNNLTFLRVLRSLRALRAFRSISFIRSLKVVVNALVTTLTRNAVDILLLLVLLMFIFSVMGHYLFGDDPSNADAYSNWGTFIDGFYTLFVFVTAEGWTSYQDNLTGDGYYGSEAFTGAFIFIGNFIISNLFIGVICENLEEATEADRAFQQERRNAAKAQKREIFLRKQHRDMVQLLAVRKSDQQRNLQQILQDLAGTLRHEDVIPMTHLSCDLTWLETFMVSLHYHENTMYRIQQVEFGIANTLAEIGKCFGVTAPMNIFNELFWW